jgi:hypothetical protein
VGEAHKSRRPTGPPTSDSLIPHHLPFIYLIIKLRKMQDQFDTEPTLKDINLVVIETLSMKDSVAFNG